MTRRVNSLNAFTLLELLVASVVSTALFLAASSVMRNYNQILQRNLVQARLEANQAVVQAFVTRLIDRAGYEDFDNNLGNHPGCFLDATSTRLRGDFDTLSGSRERVVLELLNAQPTYRGFNAGTRVLEYSSYYWNSGAGAFALRNGWSGPLVDQVEGMFLSAVPNNCNPELVIFGLLLRSREPTYRSVRVQSFDSEYFTVPPVNSAHLHSYNEFLIAPKNVVLQ